MILTPIETERFKIQNTVFVFFFNIKNLPPLQLEKEIIIIIGEKSQLYTSL